MAIRSLLGETEAATSAEEIAWAFRKTLEQAAAERPLVVVFDDIQWGEQTFLDLIEHVALLSSGASILLFCMARPELSRAPPHLAGDAPARAAGRRRRRRAHPGADPRRAARRRSLAPRAATRSSSRRCWRWPARRSGDVVVPPTLQALLAARLDQLEPAERSVLERGAIEGEIFHRGAVQALAPDGRAGDAAPGRARPQGADPTRQAAARRRGRLPLPPPADPRRRLRRAAEGDPRRAPRALRDLAGGARDRARRAGRDPRLPPRAGLPLPRRARDARRRRSGRGGAAAPDGRRPPRAAPRRTTAPPSACSSALPRSSPPGELDLVLESELVDALFWAGKGRRRAPARGLPSPSVRLRRAIVSASSAGRSRGPVPPRPSSRRARRSSCPRSSSRRCPCSRRPATTWRCTSPTPRSRRWRACAGRWGQGWRPTSGPSPTLGRRATYRLSSCASRAAARFFGTTPVSELLAWLDENEPRAGRDHFLRAYRAGALAMLGRFDEARAILAEARAELAERGGGVLLANITAFESVWVELWAGDPAAAAEFGAAGLRLFEELGELELPVDRGREPGAGALRARPARRGRRLGRPRGGARRERRRGDADALAAGQGEGARAPRRARRRQSGSRARRSRSAKERTSSTGKATRTPTSPRCSCSAARPSEAAAALEQALDRYERKGNLVMAQRMRDRLAASVT